MTGRRVATISSNNVVLSGVLAGDVANVRLNTNGYVANFANARSGQRDWGDGERIDVERHGGNELHVDATGWLDGEHHGSRVTITSGMTANNKAYDGTTSGDDQLEQRGIERGVGR